MQDVAAFLDTNVFLHCEWFEHVDWPTHLGARRVVIAVPTVVVRELDKKKYDKSATRRVRERARKVVSRFEELSRKDMRADIRDGVEMWFEHCEPTIDFDSNGLSRDDSDDCVVASILDFLMRNPNRKVVLVTVDGLMLEEEPDPRDKELRELRKQLLELKGAPAELSLVFENGGSCIECNPEEVAGLSEEDISSLMESVRTKFPGMAASSGIPFAFYDSHASRYSEKMERFYEECENYYRADSEHQKMIARAIRLSLEIRNQGAGNADNVDVFLTFPDQADVFDEESLPGPPEAPTLPSKSWMPDITFPAMSELGGLSSGTSAIAEAVRAVAHPNEPKLSFDSETRHKVRVQIRSVKHSIVARIPPLHVVFGSWEQTKSFAIECRINAGSPRIDEEGQLHVVINKG